MNKFAKKVWKMKMIHTKKSKLLLVIWVRLFLGQASDINNIVIFRIGHDSTKQLMMWSLFLLLFFKHVHPFYGSRHIFFRKGNVCKGNFGVGSLPSDFPEEEVNAWKNVIPETTGKPFGPTNFSPQQTTRSWKLDSDNIKRIVAEPGRPGQVAVRREEGRTHATGAMGRIYVV